MVINMRKPRVLFIIFIIIATLLLQATSAMASPSEKKVIMFIIDNINYEDIEKFGQKNIKYLLQNASLGMMNTNTGGSFTDSNAYATIGAGSYAVSSGSGNYFGGYKDFFDYEPVHILYKRNTGYEMKKNNIASINITSLKRNNEKLNHPVKIGHLGSLLRKNRLKTAVIGNEIINIDEIRTNAALITTDELGITDFGKVDDSLIKKDLMSPYGIKTDFKALSDSYKDVKDKSNFIVIQSGDTYRINKYRRHFSDKMCRATKAKFFKEADEFIGKVLNDVDENTLFMLVVPFPSYSDISDGKKLTPIIIYGDSIPKGTMISATTKREGLITNTDIAVEILDHFGIPKESPMTGHKFIYNNRDDNLKYLKELNNISVFNYKARPVIVKTFIGFILFVLIISLLCMTYIKDYLMYIKPLLTAVMIAPIVILILPILKPWSFVRYGLFATGLLIIFTFLIHRFFNDNLSLLSFVFLLATVVIFIDTCLKNPLMKVSILGYDPIAGARFYGIGNEYMGFLLGSTIIGTCALIDKFKPIHEKSTKLLSLLIYITILLTLAMPNLGTNVGGTMAAFIGFTTISLLLFRGEIKPRDLAIIAVILLLAILSLFIYDGTRPIDEQSHIGQTSSLVKQNSFFVLLQIFARKLSMNYKLIRYSNWTLALLAIIAALIILFRWPMGILKNIFSKYHYLYFGFISGIVGALSAFAFNDSGVVAAATSMIPIGISLILICVDEIYYEHKKSKSSTDHQY